MAATPGGPGQRQGRGRQEVKIARTQAVALADRMMKRMNAMKAKMILVVLASCFALGSAASPDYQPAGKEDGQAALDLYGDPLPIGAVARLGQDRWMHGELARTARFL